MSYRGFKTSQGDIYAVNDADEIIYYKNSVGTGQGDVIETSLCRFVPPRLITTLDTYAGRRDFDIKLKGDKKSLITITTHDGKSNLFSAYAENTPEIGSLPIKRVYGTNTQAVICIGSPIIEIYDTQTRLKQDAPPQLIAALDKTPLRTNLVYMLKHRAKNSPQFKRT